ncbi:MAG TPA: DUF202 domain-containing protein [Desulfobulbus sp.]|nr:DUF202 domain-containing protein [Desulfobulbus sp.]
MVRPFSAAGKEITPPVLEAAAQAAALRGVPLAHILHTEYHVPRDLLLQALSEYYGCPAIEYDERLPIPPELLTGLPAERLAKSGWFPVIKDADGTVEIAAVDPSDPAVLAEVEELLGPGSYRFLVALPDDISWFIQDFLHARVGELIGTERTGLAFWRNNMAQWRTRLACYRTDMAKARTALAFIRMGLSLSVLSRTLLSSKHFHAPRPLSYTVLVIGLFMIFWALPIYLRVRKSRMSPPGNQTLVEVTAATTIFLEDFQNIDTGVEEKPSLKETMLARLGDFLGNYCTILYPDPGSQERTHLARERNVLAAQRTIAACYRTIYARARTGLAFIRTGISGLGVGIGLVSYFGLSLVSSFDILLILASLLLVIDGLLWYMPVRREQAELPRTRSAVLES